MRTTSQDVDDRPVGADAPARPRQTTAIDPLEHAGAELALDADSTRDLAAAADLLRQRRWPGTATIVVAPDADTGTRAALALCRSAASSTYAHLDVHEARPSESRWRIVEIDEAIRRPTQLRPFERTHVVIADADRMSSAGYDRLLKTLEEPPGGAHFWLAVRNAESLPPTIRGRASRVLTLSHDSTDSRVAALAAAGVDAAAAHEMVQLSVQQPLLTTALAGAPHLVPAARELAEASLTHPTPTAHADSVTRAALALGAALSAVHADQEAARLDPTKPAPRRRKPAGKPASAAPGRPRWDAATPAARAQARRQIHRLLERWAQEVPGTVADADTAQKLRACALAGHAVAQAHLELDTNAPVATVLAAAISRARATAA